MGAPTQGFFNEAQKPRVLEEERAQERRSVSDQPLKSPKSPKARDNVAHVVYVAPYFAPLGSAWSTGWCDSSFGRVPQVRPERLLRASSRDQQVVGVCLDVHSFKTPRFYGVASIQG